MVGADGHPCAFCETVNYPRVVLDVIDVIVTLYAAAVSAPFFGPHGTLMDATACPDGDELRTLQFR